MVDPTINQNPPIPQPAVPNFVMGVPSLADAVAAAVANSVAASKASSLPPTLAPAPAPQVQARPAVPLVQAGSAGAPAAQSSPAPNAGYVPATQPSAPPGSIGSKILGAAEGVLSSLGDAAHAGDTRGGWLSGVLNTLNARNQRLAQERKDAVLLARTQAETLMMHRNMYKQDEEMRQQMYKANQDFVNTYKANHNIETDLTEEEIKKRIKNDPNFLNSNLVRATSEVPVIGSDGKPEVDNNGNPIIRPMYTVVSLATKDGKPDNFVVTPEMSADAKKYLNEDYPPGTRLYEKDIAHPALNVRINLARNAVNFLNKTNKEEMSDDRLKSLVPFLTDSTIQNALFEDPQYAYAGLKRHIDNSDAHILDLQAKMQADPANKNIYETQISQIQDEKSKLQQFAALAISPKQIEDYNNSLKKDSTVLDEFSKNPTKIGGKTSVAIAAADSVLNDPDTSPGEKAVAQRVKDIAQSTRQLELQLEGAKEQTKADIKAKQAANTVNNPNGLVGQAFINTLAPPLRQLFKSFEEGRIPINVNALERTDKGQQFLENLLSAYPDFRAEKGMGWPTAWNTYMVNGAPAQGKVNYNTALQHLADVYNTSTTSGLYNPLSKDYRDRRAALAIITGELAKAIKNGVATEGEVKEIEKSLTGWTAEDAKERATHAAGLLMEKINEWQNAFQQAAPSALIEVPTLLSPEAKKSYDYITSGGQRTPQQLQQQREAERNNHPIGVTRPKDLPTATGTMDFKNKQGQIVTYWTDIQGKPLRPVTPGEIPEE